MFQIRPGITFPSQSEHSFEVTRLTGAEQLSGLFGFEVDFAPRDDLDFDTAFEHESLLGQTAHLTLTRPDDDTRQINGIVSRISIVVGEEAQRPHAYRLRLISWLELWNLQSHCRIFQDMSATDVVAQLCSSESRTVRDDTRESHETFDCCTQFQETDLNFFLRILEREGIFFYFEHPGDDHLLVLADKNSAHPQLAGEARATYGHSVTNWQMEHVLHASEFATRDYDYRQAEELEASETTVSSLIANAGQWRLFDYPGGFSQQGATHMARVGIQREESKHALFSGRSVRSDFTAGARFELQGHPVARINARYILTRVEHLWDSHLGYRNFFTCIPDDASQTFRPPHSAVRPSVPGPQTAIVVGMDDPDGLGRAKVRFHWAPDADGERFVRIGELFAGNDHGTWFVPQVDDEVIVEFINGDPDRPFISGRVYNGRNTPIESDPNVNLIRSAHGQQIRYDSEAVRIENDAGCKVEIANVGDIKIVSSSGAEIEITASGEIKLTATAGVNVTASQVQVSAGMVTVDAAMLKASGVVQCSTLITNAVVSATYTPGAGNIW
jgi:type VI secretion system secreted protein VgrG